MIHFLRHGSAMCGIPGPPSTWSNGDKWISFNDEEHADEVDCPRCIQEQRDLVQRSSKR